VDVHRLLGFLALGPAGATGPLVGGYGRMDSASGAAYALSAPDSVAAGAASAIAHLNDDHGDGLPVIAQALGGYTDATSARCSELDRRGIDLIADASREGAGPRRLRECPGAELRASRGGRRVDAGRRVDRGGRGLLDRLFCVHYAPPSKPFVRRHAVP
jgi:hypothetical protein